MNRQNILSRALDFKWLRQINKFFIIFGFKQIVTIENMMQF